MSPNEVRSKPALNSRQIMALEKIARGMSVRDAMIESGYTPKTAGNMSQLRTKQTWQDLMQQFIPDELLQAIHLEGLKATQFIPQGMGRGETKLVEKPDYNARFKYLAKAYDIKGKIQDKGNAGTTIGHVSIIIQAPQELPKSIEHSDI
jgi:hypothetical protein